jgi:hypothetical protein
MLTSELYTKSQIAEILWRVQPVVSSGKDNKAILQELISKTSLWDDSKLNMECKKAIGAEMIHFSHDLYRLRY